MKKILAIHYSQSGQLTEIMENIVSGLTDFEIDFIRYQPQEGFPFPWSGEVFFNTMPETVMEETIPLKNIQYKHEEYDLIILGYQPWFLSPSLPVTALLQDETFKRKLDNTPVVTVIGARNMWLNAQESVKQKIESAGGNLIGNVPLVDKNPNLISVVSILHWMLTGKKDKKWGIFPVPGISQKDIDDATQYGQMLQNSIHSNELHLFQHQLLESGNFQILTGILFIEERAKRIFRIWAKLIKNKSKKGLKSRLRWVNFFKYYLLIALFVVSPLVLGVYHIFNIFAHPFRGHALKKKKSYYLSTDLKK